MASTELLNLHDFERRASELLPRMVYEYFVGGAEDERRTVRLGPGEGWHLPPGTRHRFTALADTEVLEVSTPELDDLVRLEDRYGRVK